jgi:transposase
VLCILYHLLIGQELYQDVLLSKSRNVKHLGAHSAISMSIDEMIETIIKAGYEVRRNERLDSG